MKPTWEYRRINLTASNHGTDEIQRLNAAGEEGWEIVHISADNVAYLKRPSKKRARQSAGRHFAHASEAVRRDSH